MTPPTPTRRAEELRVLRAATCLAMAAATVLLIAASMMARALMALSLRWAARAAERVARHRRSPLILSSRKGRT